MTSQGGKLDRDWVKSAGAAAGEAAVLTGGIYNLDHIDNGLDALQNATLEPYLQNDAPHVERRDQLMDTMEDYQIQIHADREPSELVETLDTIASDSTIAETIRSQASNLQQSVAAVQHPVAEETYDALKTNAAMTLKRAEDNHLRALNDSITVDDGYEAGIFGLTGLSVVFGAPILGGYLATKARDHFYSMD